MLTLGIVFMFNTLAMIEDFEVLPMKFVICKSNVYEPGLSMLLGIMATREVPEYCVLSKVVIAEIFSERICAPVPETDHSTTVQARPPDLLVSVGSMEIDSHGPTLDGPDKETIGNSALTGAERNAVDELAYGHNTSSTLQTGFMTPSTKVTTSPISIVVAFVTINS
jgi:hypothetical protein